MARSEEYYRVLKLTEKLEAKNRKRIREYIKRVQDDMELSELANLIERGEINQIMQSFRRHEQKLAEVVTGTFTEAGAAEAAALEASVAVAVSFDPTNERAARFAQREKERLIRGFNESQHRMVRETIAQGLRNGDGAVKTAKELRSNVGLTPYQKQMVDNYRDLLNGTAAQQKEAMARALHDKRGNRAIERSIENAVPLTNAEVDRMVDRYRERAKDNRAEAISRTETARAANMAREQSLDQIKEAVGIRDSEIIRTWNAANDAATRDTHRTMDGQQQPKGIPFRSPSGALLRFPGDPMARAEETINCRCILTTNIL